MTTFSFFLKSHFNETGKKTIAIRIVRRRENTTLSIYQSCKPKHWSQETQRVKGRAKNHKRINKFIEKYEKIIQEIIDEFELSGEPYDLKDISKAIKNYKAKGAPESYTDYVNKRIKQLKKGNKIGTYTLEEEALSVLFKFFGTKKINFRDINHETLIDFVVYLESRGNTKATIGIRLRTIRANFNKAISSGIIAKALYPFKDFKISKFKSSRTKQILTIKEIEFFKSHECQNNQEEFAQDMFLFSFYARGINYIDILLLKKSNVTGDHIDYERSKTGERVSFDINSEIKRLIEKYQAPKDSIYLMDIADGDRADPQYVKNKVKNDLTRKVNQGLKSIMEVNNSNKHITFYCARHSFATALKFANVSVEIIREALGHRDIKSTISYLATLPDIKLDKEINNVLFPS